MKLNIIDTGKNSAEVNMRIDGQLLNSLKDDSSSLPILHFYEWEGDCATYGYFTKPEQLLNMEAVSRIGLKLARRPTGGGIIFHTWDFTFSLAVPAKHPQFSVNTLENYHFVNEAVIEAIALFSKESSLPLMPSLLHQTNEPCSVSYQGFCMAKPTIYDVMVGDQKVGGAAQRRSKAGFLHQGSILLTIPPRDYLIQVLKPETGTLEAMIKNSYSLIKNTLSIKDFLAIKTEIKTCLSTVITRRFS